MARTEPLSGELQSKPVELKTGNARELGDCLGLPGGAARQAMVAEVEVLLTNHRLFTERNAESAARKVATLKPLLKQALKLQKGIQALSPVLRMELCDSPDAPALSDGEIERVFRVLAIVAGRNQVIADCAKGGRPPVEETLRQTVWGLQSIFKMHYKGPANEGTDKETEFLDLALGFAGIDHSDPISNRSRFDKLKLPNQSAA
jgi:hypothetical protein